MFESLLSNAPRPNDCIYVYEVALFHWKCGISRWTHPCSCFVLYCSGWELYWNFYCQCFPQVHLCHSSCSQLSPAISEMLSALRPKDVISVYSLSCCIHYSIVYVLISTPYSVRTLQYWTFHSSFEERPHFDNSDKTNVYSYSYMKDSPRNASHSVQT